MVELRQITRADASNSARGELAPHMAVARYYGGVKLSSLAVGQSAFLVAQEHPDATPLSHCGNGRTHRPRGRL